MLTRITKELENLKNLNKARGLQRFFKTGKGEYGEGDVFWGITVPTQREVAKKFFKEVTLQEIEKLLHSKVHEHRLTALIMLTMKYKIVGTGHLVCPEQKKIFDLYLKNTKWVNNWDLVDLSAPNIVGEYIFCRGGSACPPLPTASGVGRRVTLPGFPACGWAGRVEKPAPTILIKLAHSSSLWERRIAILSTFTFIRQNDFNLSVKIAGILLHDKHDLIHKAVGWMLREIGKRDKKALTTFLDRYHQEMPRVMLRYAIEKFDKKEKTRYLRI